MALCVCFFLLLFKAGSSSRCSASPMAHICPDMDLAEQKCDEMALATVYLYILIEFIHKSHPSLCYGQNQAAGLDVFFFFPLVYLR